MDVVTFISGFLCGVFIGMIGFVGIATVTGTSPGSMRAAYWSCIEDGGQFNHCVDKYLLLNEAKP